MYFTSNGTTLLWPLLWSCRSSYAKKSIRHSRQSWVLPFPRISHQVGPAFQCWSLWRFRWWHRRHRYLKTQFRGESCIGVAAPEWGQQLWGAPCGPLWWWVISILWCFIAQNVIGCFLDHYIRNWPILTFAGVIIFARGQNSVEKHEKGGLLATKLYIRNQGCFCKLSE